MISPLSPEDQLQLWQMLAEKLVEELRGEERLPKSYRDIRAVKGEDSTGDPEVYFKVFVDAPNGVASDSTVSRWNEFARLIQDRLIRLGLLRQPYVFLGAA